MKAAVIAIRKLINGVPFYVKASVGNAFTGVLVIGFYRKLTTKKRDIPRDTIILHQPWYGPYQMVPFALKVETYLRIMKIPYELEISDKRGPKGKHPWIKYNDQVIPDSSFIIKFINKTYNVDLDKGFHQEQLATAHGFRKMLEENTYWAIILNRWYFETTAFQKVGLPWILRPLIPIFKRRLWKPTYNHGIGRHSHEEINGIMREDLNAVSKFLGKKKFLLGDTPCQADCAVFGQLAQCYWHSFGNTSEKTIKEYVSMGIARPSFYGDLINKIRRIKEFPNLCEYCERMVSLYWPDWDELQSKHGYVNKKGS